MLQRWPKHAQQARKAQGRKTSWRKEGLSLTWAEAMRSAPALARSSEHQMPAKLRATEDRPSQPKYSRSTVICSAASVKARARDD